MSGVHLEVGVEIARVVVGGVEGVGSEKGCFPAARWSAHLAFAPEMAGVAVEVG